MTKEILEKCEELRELCKTQLNNCVTSVDISITAQGIEIDVTHRFPEELRHDVHLYETFKMISKGKEL